jgi:hypothetical protein
MPMEKQLDGAAKIMISQGQGSATQGMERR